MPDQFSLFDSDALPSPEPSPALRALGARLPRGVHLGTSSWAFPGWLGLVYGVHATETRLAREGLLAYGAHPLFRTVGIDRTFYGPIDAAGYSTYAAQVPAPFRFLVKAPSAVTDAVLRAARGKPAGENPRFLDAAFAIDHFVAPALAGLGEKAGPLVFQFSPFGRDRLRRVDELVDAIGRFFASIREATGARVLLAMEVRDPELLGTPLVEMLRRTGVRFCFAVHARMPSLAAQAALLQGELDAGPLVARWSLHSGYAYEEAKAHYAPFDRLVDEDPATRGTLARLARTAVAHAQPVFITVNNKAEGSAPRSVAKLAAAIVAPDEQGDHGGTNAELFRFGHEGREQ